MSQLLWVMILKVTCLFEHKGFKVCIPKESLLEFLIGMRQTVPTPHTLRRLRANGVQLTSASGDLSF